jgi:gluconokinase
MSLVGAVLALDVGTSSSRASLYDSAGRTMRGRSARIRYAPEVTADGGAQFDANALFEQVCSVIDQVLQKKSPPIIAVATATFWHSLLGVNARGEAVTPVFPWLDARSRNEVRGLRERLDERAVHARTGCVLHWSYWPAKLTWLRHTQPEAFRRVRRWVSFGEFLLERLTGARVLSTSMASATGLMNVHTCTWDDEVLDAVGLHSNQLGHITPLNQTSVATTTTIERWPKLKSVPWLAAIGDGACSNLGAGCSTPDNIALMIGTSGAERIVSSPSSAFQVPWGTWCYRVDERRTVLGGALNDGGSLFDWLRTTLRLPSLQAAEADVAALEPDRHGLTVLPFWGGERSPGWADDARGAIVGLRLHTTQVDILRACMEAVALRFGELDRALLEAMPHAGGLVGTGGALLHSPAWMQMVADVLGRPVSASAEAEASSRGAALLALETLGFLERPLDSLQPAVRRHFEPVAAHTERYRAAGERQRHLYDALVS